MDAEFSITKERIPTVRVKSLGRWYSLPLTDRHRGVEAEKQLHDLLAKVDDVKLPGRFKVFMY